MRRWFAGVGLVLLLAFLQRSTNNMLLTTNPLVARYDLHAPVTAVGALATIFAAATIISTYAINARIPRQLIERALLAATVTLALSFPLYSLVSTFWQLALLAIIGGLTWGVIFPFLLTLATTHSSPQQRERTVALYSLTLSFSLIVGPLVQGAALTLTETNLRAVYLVFDAVLIGAILTTLGLERTRRGLSGAVHHGGLIGEAPGVPARLLRLARNPAYRMGFVGNLAYTLPFVALVSFGGIFAHTVYHASYETIQLIFAAFFGTSFLARLSVVLTSPVRRKFEAFLLAIVLTIVGLALMGVGHSLLLFVLAFALLGIPHGVIFPLSAALIAGAVEHAELPFANSVFTSAANIVGLVLPPLVGALAGTLGYGRVFLWLGIPVALLAGVTFAGRHTE